jgi:hypothetical protein
MTNILKLTGHIHQVEERNKKSKYNMPETAAIVSPASSTSTSPFTNCMTDGYCCCAPYRSMYSTSTSPPHLRHKNLLRVLLQRRIRSKRARQLVVSSRTFIICCWDGHRQILSYRTVAYCTKATSWTSAKYALN